MKGKTKKRIKNAILKTITVIAVLTIFICGSQMQAWNGTEWVEAEPLQAIIPIFLSCGWLVVFGYANGLI